MTVKIKVPTLLEPTVMNMIKLYSTLNTSGVCGVFTPNSKHMLEETTLPVLGLLSYLAELEVNEASLTDFADATVVVPKGPINYYSLANASKGLLTVPEGLTDEPFALATEQSIFKLVVGKSTPDKPVTEEAVYAYISKMHTEGYEFTAAPLPLLPRKVVKFSINRDQGLSDIATDSVDTGLVEELLSWLKPY